MMKLFVVSDLQDVYWLDAEGGVRSPEVEVTFDEWVEHLLIENLHDKQQSKLEKMYDSGKREGT